jgi:hypothetical protein
MAEPARNNSPALCGPAVARNEPGKPPQGATVVTTAGIGTPAASSLHAGDGSSLVQGSALGPSPAHTPLPGLGLAAASTGSAGAAVGAMLLRAPTSPQQPIELVHGEGCAPSPAHEVCSTDAERAENVKVSTGECWATTAANRGARFAGVTAAGEGCASPSSEEAQPGHACAKPEQFRVGAGTERRSPVAISPTGLDPRHTSLTAGGGGLIASVAGPACALTSGEKAAPAPNNCPHCEGYDCDHHCHRCGAALERAESAPCDSDPGDARDVCPQCQPEYFEGERLPDEPPFNEEEIPW